MPLADVDPTDDELIRVSTQWNERELIKMVPGARWDNALKAWRVPKTWSSCITLRGVFGESLTVGDNLTAWAWSERIHVDTLMHLRGLITPDSPIEKDTLYPFQRVGVQFLEQAKYALLGDEMGTGKTIQALSALHFDALPAIVICPNSVKVNWAREAETWMPSTVTPYVISGSAAERKKIIDRASKDERALVIINYEALRAMTRLAPFGSTRLRRCRACDKRNGEEGLKTSQCQVHPKELNFISFRSVIIDEAHKIKDPASQQTRAVWAIAHQDSVRYRWALTGTPLANHPGDLWSILHGIAPKDFPTKTHFIDRYCLQSWNAFGGLDIVGINPATRSEFNSLLDPHFRRMPKDLVLAQLPPKTRSTRWVELTPAQRRVYKQLDEELLTVVDGGIITTPNDLIAATRLLQASSATMTIGDDGSVALAEPAPKLDVMEDVLDELGDKQLVVCAEHRKLIELAAARLAKKKISYGLIVGGLSEYERDRVLREFQAGHTRVLLFTVKAGGVGLTMTAADTILFLQRSWSMIDNKQAEDRVHRIGSERHESVHIIDVVARDTVEEKQIARLTVKMLRLQEITRDRETLRVAGADTSRLDEEEAAIFAVDLALR